MANNTVYPYGPGGQLPGGIAIVNDLVTGGADKALSAQMGVELNSKLLEWGYVLEDGFFLVDSDLNIGAKLTNDGFEALNDIRIAEI